MPTCSEIRVAVCFYGFLGNATMEGLVQDHLQLHASFDAFVVGPEERYEPLGVEADAERVDGADVCADLRRRGFGRCEAHLQPYQPMRFVNDTTPMHCLVEQGNYVGRGNFFLHYPHRTASLLWSMSRCLQVIRSAEQPLASSPTTSSSPTTFPASFSASSSTSTTSARPYDAVILARMNYLSEASMRKLTSRGGINASRGTEQQDNTSMRVLPESEQCRHQQRFLHWDIVAERAFLGSQRIEDRFISGRRDAMMKLEGLYDDYTHKAYVAQRWPETIIYAFMLRHERVTSRARLAPLSEVFSFRSSRETKFQVNWQKYKRPFFERQMKLLQPNRADVIQAIKNHSSHKTRPLRCHPWLAEWAGYDDGSGPRVGVNSTAPLQPATNDSTHSNVPTIDSGTESARALIRASAETARASALRFATPTNGSIPTSSPASGSASGVRMPTEGYGDGASDCRVAALVVGRPSSTKLQAHASLTLDNVLNPLRADVFVVTDEVSQRPEQTSPPSRRHQSARTAAKEAAMLRQVLPLVWKKRLLVFAEIQGHDRQQRGRVLQQLRRWRATAAPESLSSLASVGSPASGPSAPATSSSARPRFVLLPPPPPNASIGTLWGTHMQWYKLREAWRLMEDEERQAGALYSAVVKLRTDATPAPPWQLASFCAAASLPADEPLVVRALTDHIFWGSRTSMLRAARTFDAIGTFFVHEHRHSLRRPFWAPAMLDSLLSTPFEAFNKSTWRFHQKIGTLPFPQLLQRGDGGQADMSANLAVAVRIEKWRHVNPLDQSVARVPFVFGALASRFDRANGRFVTEKDFLVWLLACNVTICDIGLETSQYFFQGQWHERRSRAKCVANG